MPLGSALFIAWAVLVAWSDCRTRRVSNRLVMAGLVGAFISAASRVSSFAVTPEQAALALLVGCVALMPFFLAGVMGAADVKVFAVLGAWCGLSALRGIWLAASIAAAVHALVLIAAVRSRSGDASAWSPWRNRRPAFAVGAHRGAPYAALLVGAGSLHWLGSLAQGIAK
ncbi:A24 family peptidase [Trinickia soli]|uniref:A24 family peptidase n=1 Tax=Trinickia soli TaxID=380675 RepID=UPI001250E91F|nr:prepilin peptidase [Paraburkholderia sp. T12-10]